MKSPYYVATVVNAYRRALDHTAPREALLAELDCASHRDYSTGFYFGPEGARADAGGYRQTCLFVGPVVDVREGRCFLEMRNRFGVGDRLEVLSPRSLGESLEVADLRDGEGQPLTEAIRTQQVVNFPCPPALRPGDILRKRI